MTSKKNSSNSFPAEDSTLTTTTGVSPSMIYRSRIFSGMANADAENGSVFMLVQRRGAVSKILQRLALMSR